MITAKEILMKAERKYVDYLRAVVAGDTFEPIVIPCDKKASCSMSDYQHEMQDIRSLSKEVKGYGYTIEWKTVKTKMLGEQDLPSRVLFNFAVDFERFLRKETEVRQFRRDCSLILGEFPSLKSWVEKYPLKVVENADVWGDLLKVLRFFVANPRPQLYIRELPIEVHTKFIEQNKTVLKELLDIVIAEGVLTDDPKFEKRFGLRYDEPMVRMRLLDHWLAEKYFTGVDDLTLTQCQFCGLDLPLQKVFVVENKVNFLTFPHVTDSIVIWGHGYGVTDLKDSKMLQSAEIFYWGDLDAQGFEILSQFRGYYPQAQSLLMDRETFDSFYEGDKGTPSNIFVELRLGPEETVLYEYIKSNNLRLEQEKIPHMYLVNQLNGKLTFSLKMGK